MYSVPAQSEAARPASPGAVRVAGVALLAAALAAALGVVAVPAVQALGRNIPHTDVPSDYALGCLWAAAIGASIRWWPVRPGDRPLLLAAWVVRCLVALGFMLTYEWNYEALDAFAYFDGGRDPLAGPPTLLLGGGTENVTGLVWLHAQLHLASYHAIKVSFALIGFVGVYVLYRGVVRVRRRESPRVFAVLTLWPSVLFWSSILGKDPVVFLGIAMYCYGVLAWYADRRPSALLVAVAGVVLALTIRLWLGPIMAAPLGVLLARAPRTPAARRATLAGAAVLTVGVVVAFRERLLLETASDLLLTVDTVSRGWAEGGSGQQIAGDLTSVGGLVRFLPVGMFTALFRPLPGEVNNLFGALAGLESLCLLGLAAVAAVRDGWRDLANPLIQWAGVFVLTWSAVYSVLSYQNLGTAVRFRLQVLPVLLGLLVALARSRGPRGAPAAADAAVGR